MSKSVLLSLATVFFCLCSCSKYDWPGMIVGQSPDVNKRFAAAEEYNISHPVADFEASSDNYSVIVVTDLHAGLQSPEIESFVSSCIVAEDIEPVLFCLGDLTGGKGIHSHINDVFAPLREKSWRLMFTPGNHDLYFGDWNDYVQYWPSSVYTFKINTPSAGTDFFICLDSAEGTLGTQQRKWLESVLSEASAHSYRNITVITHTHFFKKDSSQGTTGNYTLEETSYLLSLFARYGVDWVLTGHDHFYERTVFRGVCYYTLNAFCEQESQHSWYVFNYSDKALTFIEHVQ